MTDREIMQQALEALEFGGWDMTTRAITDLRRALEQPAQQEPVADFKDWYGNAIWGNEDFKQGCHRAWNAAIKHTRPQAPVVPPHREPLTDEQIAKCYEMSGHYQTLRPQDRFAVFALARAIEAAHGIKGDA